MSTETEDLELRAAAAAELLIEVMVNEGLISPKKRCRSTKAVILKNSDGAVCEVDMTVAMESSRIKRCLLAGKFKNGVIAVSGSDTEIFDMAIGFCKKCVGIHPTISWEDNVVRDVGIYSDDLLDLISAANYLGMEGLKNMTCRKVADMIKGLTNDDIRELFGIKDDLTISEKKMIAKAKKAEKSTTSPFAHRDATLS
ncbi:SKP1-like protein 12 [Typha latifolia]|uniref:SKP1-like protein 12 n=1 Tax=Typha latifolia TaxID=4733 RepID=UPI003C2B6AAA